MKPFDFIWLAVGVLLTVATTWAVASPLGSDQPRLEIQTDSGIYLYSLSETKTVGAEGPLGSTLVHIEAGRALGPQVWVVDSPCKNKVCIQMGKISQPGQWVACLPNHIFVRITGNPAISGGLDASTY